LLCGLGVFCGCCGSFVLVVERGMGAAAYALAFRLGDPFTSWFFSARRLWMKGIELFVCPGDFSPPYRQVLKKAPVHRAGSSFSSAVRALLSFPPPFRTSDLTCSTGRLPSGNGHFFLQLSYGRGPYALVTIRDLIVS